MLILFFGQNKLGEFPIQEQERLQEEKAQAYMQKLIDDDPFKSLAECGGNMNRHNPKIGTETTESYTGQLLECGLYMNRQCSLRGFFAPCFLADGELTVNLNPIWRGKAYSPCKPDTITLTEDQMQMLRGAKHED